ncbi:hypothetical protein IQ07DRAFT_325620 [Pyrenochaeta sp. DS3sAY3a]|nr:hypothetical protein IQ07DRAFT_325620 [Pyrenochaeta sp. DS3sAY3a]
MEMAEVGNNMLDSGVSHIHIQPRPRLHCGSTLRNATSKPQTIPARRKVRSHASSPKALFIGKSASCQLRKTTQLLTKSSLRFLPPPTHVAKAYLCANTLPVPRRGRASKSRNHQPRHAEACPCGRLLALEQMRAPLAWRKLISAWPPGTPSTWCCIGCVALLALTC